MRLHQQVPESRRLTPDLLSALCPRFRPDGKLLLFLSHEAAARSGVHCATAALHTLPWPPPGTPPSCILALHCRFFWVDAQHPAALPHLHSPICRAAQECLVSTERLGMLAAGLLSRGAIG